ncbi:MAG: hypothetical protein OXF56_10250 [Rhodobacteraceae bacterium]|nr:hypothetical protein [Paracoccaceae bacterium]
MRFFRGIAIPESAVEGTIARIERDGLSGSEGRWKVIHSHPGDIEFLFSKVDLSTDDTRNQELEIPVICACGEYLGAAYYALKHNQTRENDTPIIVEFEADMSSIAVDGRDFLYTAFQGGNPARARPVLREAFGENVLRYAEKAWKTENQQKRIALCDLAVNDPDVVRSHYDNVHVLGGRYGTVFCSAFLVKVPIPRSAISSVHKVSMQTKIPDPDRTLQDVVAN